MVWEVWEVWVVWVVWEVWMVCRYHIAAKHLRYKTTIEKSSLFRIQEMALQAADLIFILYYPWFVYI